MLKSKIAQNSALNLAGQILPMLVGLLCIPRLIQNIGLERFGILTIVWAVIGYFSLFDFGLSRVVTAKVALLRQQNQSSEVSVVFWSSMRLILLFTVMGSIVLLIASLFSQEFQAKASASVVEEGVISLRLMALTLPAITLTSGFKGFLEAGSHFGKLNTLQIGQGFLNFCIPLGISYYTTSLVSIVLALSFLRYVFLILHFRLSVKIDPQLKNFTCWTLKKSFPLIKEGGWISITNIIGPVMMYFDRFFFSCYFSCPIPGLLYNTI